MRSSDPWASRSNICMLRTTAPPRAACRARSTSSCSACAVRVVLLAQEDHVGCGQLADHRLEGDRGAGGIEDTVPGGSWKGRAGREEQGSEEEGRAHVGILGRPLDAASLGPGGRGQPLLLGRDALLAPSAAGPRRPPGRPRPGPGTGPRALADRGRACGSRGRATGEGRSGLRGGAQFRPFDPALLTDRLSVAAERTSGPSGQRLAEALATERGVFRLEERPSASPPRTRASRRSWRPPPSRAHGHRLQAGRRGDPDDQVVAWAAGSRSSWPRPSRACRGRAPEDLDRACVWGRRTTGWRPCGRSRASGTARGSRATTAS